MILVCIFLTLCIITNQIRYFPFISANPILNNGLYILSIGLSVLLGYFGIQFFHASMDRGAMGGVVLVVVYGFLLYMGVKALVNYLSCDMGN